jgi:hypothetical protein
MLMTRNLLTFAPCAARVVLLTIVALSGGAASTRAEEPNQDRRREQELAERIAREKALKEQAVPAAVAVQLQAQVQAFGGPGGWTTDLGTSFDQTLFGADRPAADRPNADTTARLTAVRKKGEERIEKIHQIVGLSAAQRAKLRAAMEADVGRLAEEIDAVRAGYVGQKVTVGADGAGQERINQMQQDAQQCVRLMAAAFGPTALLFKVLGDTLDERQAKLYAETMAERRGTVWKALIGAALLVHDGVLGLTQAQHAAVEALLMADIPPLTLELSGQRSAGGMTAPTGLVMLRLDQAGEEKLGGLLDPRQRAVVAALAKQLGEPAELQAQLIAGGILEETP